MMSYIEENLSTGETVRYKTGYHWIVLLWPLISGLTIGFVGTALLANGWLAARNGVSYPSVIVLGAIACLTAVALLAGGIVRRIATEVVVSNKRVLIKTGLFSRRSIEVLLTRVESVGMKQTLTGRILGYGTVVVNGIGGTREEFERIRHVDEFKRTVQAQLNEAS
jgi:uncharacterized membrane protein YdbT with pleckstrin-like domain